MAEADQRAEVLPAAGNVVIPPEKWESFLSSFTRQYQGSVTTLAVTMGDEQLTETRNARLAEVSSDKVGSRSEISISVKRARSGHLTHAVRNAIKVVLYRDADGTDRGIDIFSADGTLTSVRFSALATPEKEITHRAA